MQDAPDCFPQIVDSTAFTDELEWWMSVTLTILPVFTDKHRLETLAVFEAGRRRRYVRTNQLDKIPAMAARGVMRRCSLRALTRGERRRLSRALREEMTTRLGPLTARLSVGLTKKLAVFPDAGTSYGLGLWLFRRFVAATPEITEHDLLREFRNARVSKVMAV